MLVDCTIWVLFIMMWLWMWLTWLNRVSPLDTYVGSDVTFHYIYIWLNVTFQHTNSLGVGSMRGPLMIVTFLGTCHIDIVYCAYGSSRVILSIHCVCVLILHLFFLCWVPGIFRYATNRPQLNDYWMRPEVRVRQFF